jgi:tetratricopeptide (TPR) repeat protein
MIPKGWVVAVVLCCLCLPVLPTVVDRKSFLLRDLGREQYDEALHALHTASSADAANRMLQSYSLYPTTAVAKKISWLFDMLGNVAASSHWQQLFVRTANITHIQWLNEGIRHHYAEDYSAALHYYNALLEADASSVDALYHKGVTYQHLGDIQQAAGCYYDTIQLDPFHTKAILNLAALHQKYGSYQDAVNYYEKGLDVFQKLAHQRSDQQNSESTYLHPHHSMVQYNLGLAYMQLNQLDKVGYVALHLLSMYAGFLS